MERKSIQLEDVQLKFASDKPGTFSGYASTFGGEPDEYGDVILPGAFKASLVNRKRKVLMLFEHDAKRVIGKWLSLEEDDKGLFVEGELTPGHTEAQNVYASLKHGALDGLSIGYRVNEGGALREGGVRWLSSLNLIEISPCSRPANHSSTVIAESVKSAIDAIDTWREFENVLRECGDFSASASKHLVAQAKTLVQRDVEAGNQAEAEAKTAELIAEFGEVFKGFSIPTSIRGN